MRIKPGHSKFKKKLVTVKVTTEDLETIKDKANLYTDGNMSEWIRYSSTQLLPKTKDLLEGDDDEENTDSM